MNADCRTTSGSLRASVFLAAVFLFVLFGAGVASACPMCKAALAGQEGQGDLVSGFFWSILFMMSMPFTILGAFSGYMFLLVRRAKVHASAAGPDERGGEKSEG